VGKPAEEWWEEGLYSWLCLASQTRGSSHDLGLGLSLSRNHGHSCHGDKGCGSDLGKAEAYVRHRPPL
jgi:hypothetical protein